MDIQKIKKYFQQLSSISDNEFEQFASQLVRREYHKNS